MGNVFIHSAPQHGLYNDQESNGDLICTLADGSQGGVRD
jgi:hypothetical protein